MRKILIIPIILFFVNNSFSQDKVETLINGSWSLSGVETVFTCHNSGNIQKIDTSFGETLIMNIANDSIQIIRGCRDARFYKYFPITKHRYKLSVDSTKKVFIKFPNNRKHKKTNDLDIEIRKVNNSLLTIIKSNVDDCNSPFFNPPYTYYYFNKIQDSLNLRSERDFEGKWYFKTYVENMFDLDTIVLSSKRVDAIKNNEKYEIYVHFYNDYFYDNTLSFSSIKTNRKDIEGVFNPPGDSSRWWLFPTENLIKLVKNDKVFYYSFQFSDNELLLIKK